METLEKIDNIIKERHDKKQKDRHFSDRIGCSWAGNECERSIWLTMRNIITQNHDAASIKRFEDGNLSEDLMAARLRLDEDIRLVTHVAEVMLGDLTSDEFVNQIRKAERKQIHVSALGGKLTGYLDGKITGLAENPDVEHVWEHKSVGTTNYKKLLKIIKGESESILKDWSIVYYTQAQLYMGLTGLNDHYMTVANEGLRNVTAVFTKFDKEYYQQSLKRVESILLSNSMPFRSDNKKLCYMCPFNKLCNQCNVSNVNKNCLSCSRSELDQREDGSYVWVCNKSNNMEIPEKILKKGCKKYYDEIMLDEIPM